MLHELFYPPGTLLLLVSQRFRCFAEVRRGHDKVGVVLQEAVEVGLHHLKVLLRPAWEKQGEVGNKLHDFVHGICAKMGLCEQQTCIKYNTGNICFE